MQTFLLSSRSTASGNGMGTAGAAVVYKASRPGTANRFPRSPARTFVLSVDERRHALEIAREAIDRALSPAPPKDPATQFASRPLPPVFEEHRGVFVSLKRHPSGALRGCIGYPLPILPLRTALPRAAVAAAVEDPRFAPVRRTELSRLIVEVSVLTVPTVLDGVRPDARAGEVSVGRDGLIVEGFGRSGLLLPQVGPEQGWSAEELLDGTCEKAGLPSKSWRTDAVTVRRFEADVFWERVPSGDPEADAVAVSEADGRAGP